MLVVKRTRILSVFGSWFSNYENIECNPYAFPNDIYYEATKNVNSAHLGGVYNFQFYRYTESIKNCTACCHVCFTFILNMREHKNKNKTNRKQKSTVRIVAWQFTIRNLFSLLDISLLIISFCNTKSTNNNNNQLTKSTEDMF